MPIIAQVKFPERVRLESERCVREAVAVASRERRSLVVETKPDGSLVTNVDRAIEEFLRDALRKCVPGAGFWGEEMGRDEDRPEGLWLIDPIDGTTNFAHGSPLWGISVALCVGDQLIGGSVALPDLGELYSGGQTCGAFLNGEPMRQIVPGPIERFQPISVNDTTGRIHGLPGKHRCSGCFVIDGCFTAMGRFRALYGANEHLYDVAACVLIASEVGMDYHYLDGTRLDLSQLKSGGKIINPWTITPAIQISGAATA